MKDMTTSQEYSKTLEHLAKPFVEAGIYKSEGAFVKDMVKGVASQKIKAYERIVRKYETSYGSLENFRKKIKSKATPKQEDQWMEWEAALNMLKAWKGTTKELGMSAD